MVSVGSTTLVDNNIYHSTFVYIIRRSFGVQGHTNQGQEAVSPSHTTSHTSPQFSPADES